MHVRSAATALSLFLAALLLAATWPAQAQWTHRYPKVSGFNHHIYLEGYELPGFNHGASDPAPSPDGRTVALAARGWIWLLDEESGDARRLTRSGGVDSRPAWSPDGRHLAFVRDDGRTTRVVLRELASGAERTLAEGLALDPAFSADGRHVYYSWASEGDLDLWRMELASGRRERLTATPGIELRPVVHPAGEALLYLHKISGGNDAVRMRALDAGADAPGALVVAGRVLSQTRPALSPDGRTLAVALPSERGWELRLLDVQQPAANVLLYRARSAPLSPAWSADGRYLYFAEADSRQQLVLKRLPVVGGEPQAVQVRRWDHGEPTARLRVRTRLAASRDLVAARLAVRDVAGHPIAPPAGPVYSEGQTGAVFFYSPGEVEIEVPAGRVEVTAVHGLVTPPATLSAELGPGETRTLEVPLQPVWNAAAAGWYSGDHHFHLNYGGIYGLRPDDLLTPLRAEALDVGTPLLGNLHDRVEDQHLWGWQREVPPLVGFGQEIRSHFLGHVSLIGSPEMFRPWFWGPGYEVYSRDDRPNSVPLRHARERGGFGMYVHPVRVVDPFTPQGIAAIPLGLVADAVLGDLDALEIACLWSSDAGTAEVWYRLLSVGRPVAASGGTDVMTDLYRTMALGTARVYVKPRGPFTVASYTQALREGRSFVTTGPMLLFQLDGREPGEAVGGPGTKPWSLELHSAVPVERVEILVNGQVAWSAPVNAGIGTQRFTGALELPAGGWVAARAVGGATKTWPAMSIEAFAHSSPVWLGSVGSTDPVAARKAAEDLLRALDHAETRMQIGYGSTPIPNLSGRMAEARQRLQSLL